MDVLNAVTGKVRHLSAEPAFSWFKTWTPKLIHFTVRQVSGQYFAATGNSLVAFNDKTGKQKQVSFPRDERVMALGNSVGGKVLLATTRALYQVNDGHIRLLVSFPALPDSIHKIWLATLDNKKSVGKILVSRNGKWVIPAVGGLYLYDTKNNACVYVGHQAEASIPYSSVLATDGNIYYPLNAGMYKLSGEGPPELVYGNGAIHQCIP